MWWSDSWFSDYWPFPWMMGPLMMMVFFFVCLAMMSFMMRHRRHGSADYAIALLKERYARGEINRAEFEERRRILES